MSKSSKFFLPVVVSLGLVGSLVGGVVIRDRLDKGVDSLAPIGSPEDRSMIASTQNRGEVPAGDYFYDLSELLGDTYVDPIADQQKLAIGAIRGMIASLADPDSTFMTPEQVAIYRDQQKGLYHGIGVELVLSLTDEQRKTLQDRKRVTDLAMIAPSLVITAVIPGSPAEKAGLQVGDRIRAIDNKWAVTKETIKEFRDLQEQIASGKLPEDRIDALRKEIADKAKNSITAGRAREQLITSKSASLDVEWTREGKIMTAKVEAQPTQVPAVQKVGSTIQLRFQAGASEALAEALKGLQSATLDLRQSGEGSMDELRKVLEVVAAPGSIGTLLNERKKPTVPVTITRGAANPIPLTLIVDGTTRGAAEMFALGLSTRGQAKLQGSGMAGDRTATEFKELPDGSAYLLALGKFRPDLAAAKEAKS